MMNPITNPLSVMVALRKESVDRNTQDGGVFPAEARRSPQGERG